MRVAVVGGGPSGMMAAIAAAREMGSAGEAALFERNEKLGKKLYITGKGRCNLTNTASGQDFFDNVPRNPRFLHSALSAMDSRKLIEFFAELGLPTTIERGGRVFPESQKASDVTRAMQREMNRLMVGVRLNARVVRLVIAGGRAAGVELEGGEVFEAGAVIVCTGGVSYPSTGSTGDGWAFASRAGLACEPPRASLVGMQTRDDWPRRLSGLTLRNVRLTARYRKKTLTDELGELLLTHFGVSGPLVLTLSALTADLPLGEVEVFIDLKPGMTPEEVDARLVREVSAAPNKLMGTLLAGWLPERLAEEFAREAGIDPRAPANALTRQARAELAARMKRMPLALSALRPVEEAVITRGGVSVKELDPSTLMCKRVPGLFFAGETVDVDALTGGFNLQIAFSTGRLAGHSAARMALGI